MVNPSWSTVGNLQNHSTIHGASNMICTLDTAKRKADDIRVRQPALGPSVEWSSRRPGLGRSLPQTRTAPTTPTLYATLNLLAQDGGIDGHGQNISMTQPVRSGEEMVLARAYCSKVNHALDTHHSRSRQTRRP